MTLGQLKTLLANLEAAERDLSNCVGSLGLEENAAIVEQKLQRLKAAETRYYLLFNAEITK